MTNDKCKKTYDYLNELFPNATCELEHNSAFELLIAVILSAQCTDARVNKVTKVLFKEYNTPQKLAFAKQDDIEKIIYSCGFYHNKAKNLIMMAKDLVERFGGEVPQTYDDLLSLAGVGRKTANVVMSVGFNIPAIAVDTHVFRVSNRLDMARSKTPLECELKLQKEVTKDRWSRFHHLLVLFGRYVCSSQHPHCTDCELKKYCVFYKQKRPAKKQKTLAK